jgi:predicted dehydrogenase
MDPFTGVSASGNMRLALVGCGAMAHRVLTGFITANKDCTITAVCDPDTESREKILQRLRSETTWNPPVPFRTLEEALATHAASIDGVLILTPTDLHEEQAMLAIRANKHVFIERPIALDVESGKRIVLAAKDANVILCVGENAQFWHEVLIAKDVIDSRQLGRVLTARAKLWETTYNRPVKQYEPGNWRCDIAKAGGGYMFDSGFHWIRPLRMWFGDVESVVAVSGTSVRHMPQSMGMALLKFKSGHAASFETYLSDAPMAQQPWFVIQCEKGEIVIDGSFEGGFGVKVYNFEHPEGYLASEKPQGWAPSYDAETKYFLDLCKSGRADISSALLGLGDLEILTAMNNSMETGKWVHVRESV